MLNHLAVFLKKLSYSFRKRDRKPFVSQKRWNLLKRRKGCLVIGRGQIFYVLPAYKEKTFNLSPSERIWEINFIIQTVIIWNHHSWCQNHHNQQHKNHGPLFLVFALRFYFFLHFFPIFSFSLRLPEKLLSPSYGRKEEKVT